MESDKNADSYDDNIDKKTNDVTRVNCKKEILDCNSHEITNHEEREELSELNEDVLDCNNHNISINVESKESVELLKQDENVKISGYCVFESSHENYNVSNEVLCKNISEVSKEVLNCSKDNSVNKLGCKESFELSEKDDSVENSFDCNLNSEHENCSISDRIEREEFPELPDKIFKYEMHNISNSLENKIVSEFCKKDDNTTNSISESICEFDNHDISTNVELNCTETTHVNTSSVKGVVKSTPSAINSSLFAISVYGDSSSESEDDVPNITEKQIVTDRNCVNENKSITTNCNAFTIRQTDCSKIDDDISSVSTISSGSSSPLPVARDFSDNEEDVDVELSKRPMKKKANKMVTKGELTLDDLPPIQDLSISVPKEQCIMLGKIFSVVDKLVVVQGIKNLPALDLETVLFLESDKPLGHVFDVFGPVVEPLYCVRFNANVDIKSKNISVGLPVYFVPKSDHTRYVFLAQLTSQKGSDASWEDNNEPPVQFLDYSDDEEERNALRSIKRELKKEIKSDPDVSESKLSNIIDCQDSKRNFGKQISKKNEHQRKVRSRKYKNRIVHSPVLQQPFINNPANSTSSYAAREIPFSKIPSPSTMNSRSQFSSIFDFKTSSLSHSSVFNNSANNVFSQHVGNSGGPVLEGAGNISMSNLVGQSSRLLPNVAVENQFPLSHQIQSNLFSVHAPPPVNDHTANFPFNNSSQFPSNVNSSFPFSSPRFPQNRLQPSLFPDTHLQPHNSAPEHSPKFPFSNVPPPTLNAASDIIPSAQRPLFTFNSTTPPPSFPSRPAFSSYQNNNAPLSTYNTESSLFPSNVQPPNLPFNGNIQPSTITSMPPLSFPRSFNNSGPQSALSTLQSQFPVAFNRGTLPSNTLTTSSFMINNTSLPRQFASSPPRRFPINNAASAPFQFPPPTNSVWTPLPNSLPFNK